jgi:hypothetical protein
MYEATKNWSYLFYPPPYNFLAPSPNSRSEDVLQPRGNGMGCGGGCGCAGLGCGGLGQDATTISSGLFGTGLFTSADFSQWTWVEWAAAAAAVYFVGSAISDLGKGSTAVRRSFRSRKRTVSV